MGIRDYDQGITLEPDDAKADFNRGTTKATTQDVYCAIGQLLVHENPNGCEKVLVLPITEKISPNIKETLKRLNIDLLRFKLNKVSATILDLKVS